MQAAPDWTTTRDQPSLSSDEDSPDTEGRRTPTPSSHVVSPDHRPNKHRRRSLSESGPTHSYGAPATPKNRKQRQNQPGRQSSPLPSRGASPPVAGSPTPSPREPSPSLSVPEPANSPMLDDGDNNNQSQTHADNTAAAGAGTDGNQQQQAPNEAAQPTTGDTLDITECPDFEDFKRRGVTRQEGNSFGSRPGIDWSSLTADELNATAGYTRWTTAQLQRGGRDIEQLCKNTRVGQLHHIAQNRLEWLIVRPSQGGTIHRTVLGPRFVELLRSLLADLGEPEENIAILTPEPRKRAAAAASKIACPSSFMAHVTNPRVRDILTCGHFWTKSPESSFIVRPLISSERSWTIRVWIAHCSGLSVADMCALLRWVAARRLWNHLPFCTAVDLATANDPRPLKARLLDVLTTFDAIPAEPLPENHTGSPVKLILTCRPIDGTDYKTMSNIKLGIRQLNFVHGASSFTLSPAYLADKRALRCNICGLDWHITSECRYKTFNDYSGPRDGINELVQIVLGAEAQSTIARTWAQQRQSADQDDLEEDTYASESDEFTPTIPGYRGNNKPRGGGRVRGRRGGRGRGY
ncbi:hypothetical protein V5O48_015981 [Marasmius crinis-equi]|uniref:Uncharacterized protein n=1 Tax=Marasmius crinis-equi TaxID=585013 RepID=A0ABR3ET18_9AGAR